MNEHVLAGQLGPIGLAGLIQLIESELLTGLLQTPGGKLRFRGGQMVGATSIGGTTGTMGIRDAFLAPDGPFEFTCVEIPEAPVIGSSVMLIMDACRVVDDWVRIAPMRLGPADDFDPAGLDAEVLRIIDQMDGERVVAEAVANTNSSAGRATDPLLELYNAGRLVKRGPSAPERVSQAPPEPATLSAQALDEFELMEEGRRFLRARAFGEARACFMQAQQINPGSRRIRQNLARLDAIETQNNRKVHG